jgi:hypothetical protein
MNPKLVSLTLLAVSMTASAVQGHSAGGHHGHHTHHHTGAGGGRPGASQPSAALTAEQRRMRMAERRAKYTALREAEIQRRLARQQQRQSVQAKAGEEQGNEFLPAVNGTLDWPTLLRGDDFKSQRIELEAAFSRRAAAPDAEFNDDDARQIEQCCNELLAQLARHGSSANANDWIEAKRFVNRLAAEGRRPSTIGRVAGD